MVSAARSYPGVDSKVFHTEAGTPYLRGPGVAMVSAPAVDLSGLAGFLNGYGPELNFGQYIEDPVLLDDATQLVKVAGQACYASFGPGARTMNAEAGKYIENILSSGHGSVLEHANFTFYIWGISRSNTHEFVRHRAGFAYSQLSQRYVDGKVLRFVERPEFASNPALHRMFEGRIDQAAIVYEELASGLLDARLTDEAFQAMAPRDRRKTVNQAARDALPNETETFMAVTGNVRAWRHFVEMRASEHAETAIRATAVDVFRCLHAQAPLLFDDHELAPLPDGTWCVVGGHDKV